jgi:hypothetical protein
MRQPMKCGTALPGGGKCEELVTVTGVQYVYDREPVEGELGDYVLDEIHYTAVCPACGERKLRERPAAD